MIVAVSKIRESRFSKQQAMGPRKSYLLFPLVSIVLILLLLTLPACGGVTPQPTSTPGQVPTASPIQPDWAPPPVTTAQLDSGLSPVVNQVKPGVVAISVQVVSTNIFGQPTTQEGAGSGWIIDANGLIVTNDHVISGADTIVVTLDDDRTFSATQVSADAVSDLAVIKIDATGLPTVPVGDSSQMRVGMPVAAIGNALGRGISMTGGWISRLGASITLSRGESLYDLIETDAAINPGNSGGPLINTAGEVIGITNAKLIATGVEGIGFAISTNTAIPVITDLIQRGYVVRPWIGVALQTVTAGVALIRGLSVDSGALINEVAQNSPAAEAGLQAGDVIVKIGGEDIATASDAAQAIRSSTIGQELTITYWRGSNQDTTNVIPQSSPVP